MRYVILIASLALIAATALYNENRTEKIRQLLIEQLAGDRVVVLNVKFDGDRAIEVSFCQGRKGFLMSGVERAKLNFKVCDDRDLVEACAFYRHMNETGQIGKNGAGPMEQSCRDVGIEKVGSTPME